MQEMNIDKIKVSNQYLRLDTNVDKLKKSIETVGLIHPLILNINNELIAGGRRYTALKALGHKTVEVQITERSELEQELISIDENLVRKDLTNLELEKSLSRGRELYEKIYPSATKFEEELLETPEDNEIMTDAPNASRSFIDLTAEKTGLSKKVIKSAIDRDVKASKMVKDLRALGDLNATQTNEIIKLDKEEQDGIAEMVVGRSAKEIKSIVKSVIDNGMEYAIDDVINSPSLPAEYKSLGVLLKRANKVLGKILLEEVKSDHDEVSKILDQMSTLRVSLDQFLLLQSSDTTEDTTIAYANTDYDYDSAVEDTETNFEA